jgi:hypothetical protein
MKVMLGETSFLHTAVVPLIVAVGNGFTVITALPACAWLHAVLLASCTLINV